MFRDFDEARRFVTDNDVKMVDLKYADLWGRWHHVTVPAGQFGPSLMEEGVGFDASSVGLKPLKAGDMVVVPDLSTGFLDPFWEARTLSFICTAGGRYPRRVRPRPAQHRPPRRGLLAGAGHR